MTFEELAAAFPGQRKPTAKGSFMVTCPCHADDTGSLHLSPGNGSGPLLHCHAGCATADILAAIGLGWPDVLPPRSPKTTAKKIVATYDYTDDSGRLLYQAVRYEPKDFRQRRPDPDHSGRWLWRLGDVLRVPYRLPEVIAAVARRETVFVVEGEKDADNLARLGLTATSNAGGAGKWRPEYSEALLGANVVILPDNDVAGREHAAEVATALAGSADSVRIVRLPDLPEKGDVSDWIAARGTVDQLKNLVAAAPAAASTPETEPQLITTRASDVVPTKVDWLWDQRLPLGKLVVLAGEPGLGKSRITLSIAATVSRGGVWPEGEGHSEQGEVLIANFEDDQADTTVPRLMAEKADLTQIHFLDAVPDKEGRRTFDLSRDTPRLAAHLKQHPKIRLVIVDPITACMIGVDSHKNAEVRSALHPLSTVAQDHRVCVLAVTHLNKGSGMKAMHRVTGSIAFTAAARVVFLVTKDEREMEDGEEPEEGINLFIPVKNNLGDDHIGLTFWTDVERVAEDIDAPKIVWGERIDVPADKALNGVSTEEKGPRDDAKAFLRELLANGPVTSKQVQVAAKAAGVAEKTLRRAKSELNVVANMSGTAPQVWSWAMPPPQAPRSLAVDDIRAVVRTHKPRRGSAADRILS